VAARSTTFQINDRLKTVSQIISISQPQQINSVNNRDGLLFHGSHTWHLCEEFVLADQLVTWCLLLIMKVSSVTRRVSALLLQSCSILTEERLFRVGHGPGPSMGWAELGWVEDLTKSVSIDDVYKLNISYQCINK